MIDKKDAGLVDWFYLQATYVFDPLHHWWESKSTQKGVAALLVIIFIASMGMVELNRQEMLPPFLAAQTPTSHYMAINLAFTLVLILEVLSLIFTLPCSMSKAVGKQFEILALIMLRSSFKELVHFPEPIKIVGHETSLLHIVSDGSAALVIFALLGVYSMIRKGLDDENTKGNILFRFTSAKKMVALVLLVIFAFMGFHNLHLVMNNIHTFDFFQAFYTVLIFSDILLVLISQRYFPSFKAVFRNSGFALATLFIRLALTASPYLNAIIGVGSAVYAVFLTLIYNSLFTTRKDYKQKPR